MAEDQDQTKTLADRLVSYSDALVAVAFVGVSGLGLAVADPDIRTDIVRAAYWVMASNVILGVILSWLIHLFRRWELELRANLPAVPTAERFSQYLHWGRLGAVWVVVLQAVGLMFAIR